MFPLPFIGQGLSAISGGIKNLFSGKLKERREQKKAEKDAMKAAKEAAKNAQTVDAVSKAKATEAKAKTAETFAKVKNWLITNWVWVAVAAGIYLVYTQFLAKKKSVGRRRVRRVSVSKPVRRKRVTPNSRGTAAQRKAWAAKMRRARKRK